MAYNVSIKQLKQGARLQDGDRIRTTVEAGDVPDEYAFTLTLGPNVTWWKGLIAVNDSGQQTQVAEVQDDNNTAELLLTQEDLDEGATLEIWKAKAFGAHTHMYTITDVSRVRGKHCTLTWKQD